MKEGATGGSANSPECARDKRRSATLTEFMVRFFKHHNDTTDELDLVNYGTVGDGDLMSEG